MLDFGFSELVVIGVVALIVIGPERLPRVARTAGHLLGRFQRYVADVKADISREMDLADLKKLQSSVEDAARSIEHSVKTGMEDAQKEFKEAQTALESTGAELKKTEDELKQAVAGITMPHMGTAPAALPTAGEETGAAAPEAPASLPDSAQAQSVASEPGEMEGETPSPQLELGLGPAARPSQHSQP
jgi:sec-independent protein translocase protein TatB